VGTMRTREGGVEVFVRDNGKGLSQFMQLHLFEPFRTTKAGGTGLGLTVSRAIADKHKGSLLYHPNVTAGACFALRLPAAGTLEPHPHA